MMQLVLKDNLPFLSVKVGNDGKSTVISDVLLDTGSASTIISADYLNVIGIQPSPEDVLNTIRGIGGVEVVFVRKVEFLEVGERKVLNFEIEVGGMDYGFKINGILGMDFLTESGAIIDLHEMSLDFRD